MPTIEDIDLHVRSYRSALKSSLEITINSLTQPHLRLKPILHPLCQQPKQLDTSALIYSLLRLPPQVDKTRLVLIGQNPRVFSDAGYQDIETNWKKVNASARRRSSLYSSKKKILAVFAASISDVDDLTNILIAFQYQWNRLHFLLRELYPKSIILTKAIKENHLANDLNLNQNDYSSLITAFGPKYHLRLRRIYRHTLDLRLRLLAGSWLDYTKTTQRWWKNIATAVSPSLHLSRQHIYFVSSNLHSLLNLFTGFPIHYQKEIIKQIQTSRPDLFATWQQILSGDSPLHQNDFLYYVSRYLLPTVGYSENFLSTQKKLDIMTIPSEHYVDINTQIFPIKNLLRSQFLDSRLKISRPKKIETSDAIIFNIDYPLGFSAYHILSETMQNVASVRGVYILGKSAVLNSEIGDIQIPRLVFDEHTQNSFIFKNCFNSYFPFVNRQGSILTNQKAVSVLGTFLENEALLKKYSENNITIIEMESGPFLNAICESTYDQQTPKNTIIDLNTAPFDIGIINYTSDTPYSQAKNLGSTRLDLNGVEPVYLGTLAILQRIINLEEQL